MSMTPLAVSKEIANLVTWGGDDPFTHTLVIGPTRCGKTSKLLKPLIYQILKAKKRGAKVGLTVIEPKGDVARMVKEMSIEMGLEDELVYVDPLYPDETDSINVMKGEKNDVAEATVAVLKSLFGKQDAFFALVQELSSRKVTLLLKELYGDNMDIIDVLSNLRDESLLKANVEKHRTAFGTTELVAFFDNELLGSGQMADRYRQFILGLRAQLENITSNEYLRAIVTGKSDVDLDAHLEKGGILAVNTALGKLGKSGDAFGMFMAMHMQLATFRRPGTERTRIPHYLIIDEYSRYINPDVERFLSIAAEYRVALIAAIQSLSQLELESGQLSARAMKSAILTSTRNKIVFGGLEYDDAEEVSRIMGSDPIVERSRSYDGGILKNILPKTYRDDEVEKLRFTPTFLMDGLEQFHCVCKLLINGTPRRPFVGVGEFVPYDWKEQLKAEEEQLNNWAATRKRPPIFRWRERALYDVKVYEQAIFKEKQMKLSKADPFKDMKNEEESNQCVNVQYSILTTGAKSDQSRNESLINDSLNQKASEIIDFESLVIRNTKTPTPPPNNKDNKQEQEMQEHNENNLAMSLNKLKIQAPSENLFNKNIENVENTLSKKQKNDIQPVKEPVPNDSRAENESKDEDVGGFWGNF